MKARFQVIGLLTMVLLLGGCVSIPRPPIPVTPLVPTVEPAPQVTQGPAPTSSPLPAIAETVAAPPVAAPPVVPTAAAPTAVPIATEAGAFNIGVPAGDAYSPQSVVVDDERDIAYVYHADSGERRPVISVVDLTQAQVVRIIRLRGTEPAGAGRLLLTPDARQLILIDVHGETLTPIDPATGTLGAAVPGIRDGALSPDGRVLYALGLWGLRAYLLADLLGSGAGPVWEIQGERFERVATGGERIVVTQLGPERRLVSFDAATGAEVAHAALPDYPGGVASGPAGGWAITLSGEKPRLVRYDAALNQIAEKDITYAYDLTYDGLRHRYLIAGYPLGQGAVDRPILFGLDEGDLASTIDREWPPPQFPTVFVPWGGDRLIGFSSYGSARLEILDGASLERVGRIITGVRAVDLAVDDGSGTLYVADDHNAIHVLSLPDGVERAVWEGGAPLVLDLANRRLYANSDAGVRALDPGTGEVVASFPQQGVAAPDPNRNVVYIVQRGVSIFDRNGKQIGTLASTFPEEPGMNPNPYAVAATVNPVTGHVAVVLNNGVPGSNNGSFVRIYPPETDRPLDVGSPHSFVSDVRTDEAGNWFITYGPTRGQEAVQVLRPSGEEIRRLAGRTGRMVLDEANQRLNLLLYGTTTVLDARSLVPIGFFAGPESVAALAFSKSQRTVFTASGAGPVITLLRIDHLQPIDMGPEPGAPAPDAVADGLLAATDGRTSWLIVHAGGFFRTRDGRAWEKLPVGVHSPFGNFATAEPNAIFYAGQGAMGADGVWRSLDAGNSWELLAAGLTDLRPVGPVLAAGADVAYFLNRTQGLLRWNADANQWQEVEGKPVDGRWGEIRLAPDGALFRVGVDLLARSDDRGKSWESLEPPAEIGQIIGYTPLYTVTHTLFGIWGNYSDRKFLRSRDAGATWEPVEGMIDFSSEYYTPAMANSWGDMYLLAVRSGGAPPFLFRSTDSGESWLVAPPELAVGAASLAGDPAKGTLWLGVTGGVRAVVPDEVAWAPAKSVARAAQASPSPAPTPGQTAIPGTPAQPRGLQPTATAGPCDQPLTGEDADLNSLGLGIGCPRGPAVAIQAARQRFQSGQMIWRQDQRWIYVLYNDGVWEGYGDRWIEGDPAGDPTIVAPDGFQQPLRGFGKVWRESLGGPSAAIGWALEKEQGQTGQAQDWQYGTVLRFGGTTIVLFDRGVWQ